TTSHKSILILAKSPRTRRKRFIRRHRSRKTGTYLQSIVLSSSKYSSKRIANATTSSLMPARSTSESDELIDFFHGWRSSNKFGGCRGRCSLHQQSTIFKYSRRSS
ncbi:unnamed protein product, partial [Heterotrigona itama]